MRKLDVPIRDCRNLGPKTEAELNSIGIRTLRDLKSLGWEEVCLRYVFAFPKRLNLTLVCAIIGAISDEDWRRVPPEVKARAKEFVEALRKS